MLLALHACSTSPSCPSRRIALRLDSSISTLSCSVWNSHWQCVPGCLHLTRDEIVIVTLRHLSYRDHIRGRHVSTPRVHSPQSFRWIVWGGSPNSLAVCRVAQCVSLWGASPLGGVVLGRHAPHTLVYNKKDRVAQQRSSNAPVPSTPIHQYPPPAPICLGTPTQYTNVPVVFVLETSEGGLALSEADT